MTRHRSDPYDTRLQVGISQPWRGAACSFAALAREADLIFRRSTDSSAEPERQDRHLRLDDPGGRRGLPVISWVAGKGWLQGRARLAEEVSIVRWPAQIARSISRASWSRATICSVQRRSLFVKKTNRARLDAKRNAGATWSIRPYHRILAEEFNLLGADHVHGVRTDSAIQKCGDFFQHNAVSALDRDRARAATRAAVIGIAITDKLHQVFAGP